MTNEPILEPAALSGTHRPPRRPRRRLVVELARRNPRGVPAPRLRALAGDRAQPGAHAAPRAAPEARTGQRRPHVPRAVRPGGRRARRGARRAQHLVVAQLSAAQRTDCLLLRRVRAAPVAPDLRRRSRRARRRSLQGSERPRRAAHRRRVHVPAGVFPSAHFRRGLAGRELRAAELGRRADRGGAHAGRQAVHHRGAARRSLGTGGGVARASRPRETVPARYRSRRERPLGPRAFSAPVRRRPRDAHPAGDHPRHRRRPDAEGARRGTGGLSSERRARRLCRAAADPRPHRAGDVLRRRARADPADHDLHDAHAGAGRARRLSVSPRRRRISPAAGGRSGRIGIASWRSAPTTTASARNST